MAFYKIFFALMMVAVASLTGAYGENCANITGTWYNQLGSEMILQTDSSDEQRLTGEYRTAVERESGSAGKSYSTITGLVPKPHVTGEQTSSVFGFAVLWRGGNSTTAWLAQCLVCGGVERIVTTWILRSRVDSCVDKWKAVMTGRDYFTREEQRTGPRASRRTNTPLDRTRPSVRRTKRDLRERPHDMSAPSIRTSINVAPAKPLDVNVDVLVDAPKNAELFQADAEEISQGKIHGLWYNELGSEMNLHHRAPVITGSYKTTSERMQQRRASRQHGEMLGVGNHRHRDTTLSLLMSWNNGDSITAWVGQVHLCMETNRPVELLEAAFLHRTRIDQCHAEWKATIHGHTTFSRNDPFQNGGQQIAVSEFGEETTC